MPKIYFNYNNFIICKRYNNILTCKNIISSTMTKKYTIQIFSDLHIEIWNKLPQLPIMAKYLFLAGDICSENNPLFYKFFDYCSKNWEKTFYVPGNIEFYNKNKNFDELRFEYKYKFDKKYKNVFYLDNDFISLDDEIDVYGTVFWTYPNFASTYEATLYTNDYNNITYFNKERRKIVKWDISYVKKLSKDSYYLLQNHLAKTKRKTIVITHFPPITTDTTSESEYKRPNLLSYLSWKDDTIQNFNLKKVPVWISGHTHLSYNIDKNGCKFVSNQLGCKSEIDNTGINEDGVFQVEI